MRTRLAQLAPSTPPVDDGRVSLARCREILGQEYAGASEEELLEVREALYALAGMIPRRSRQPKARGEA